MSKRYTVIIQGSTSAHSWREVGAAHTKQAALKLAAQHARRHDEVTSVVSTATPAPGREPAYAYAPRLATCTPTVRRSKRIAECTMGKRMRQRKRR